MNTTIKKLTISAALFAAAAVPAFGPLVAVASADTGLVKNGDFSQGTTHWTPGAAVSLTATPDQRLKVANTHADVNASVSGAYQCVELTGAGTYALSAKVHIEPFQLGSGAAQIGASFHSGAGCSGASLGSEFTPQFRDTGVTTTQSKTLTPPDGAVSARVRVMVHKDKAASLPLLNQFAVHFDDVSFKKNPLIIINGPILLPQASPTPKIVLDGPLLLPTATPTPKIEILVPTKTVTPTATPTTPQIQNPPTKTPTATPTQPQIQIPPTKTPTATPTQPQIQNPPTNTPTPAPEVVEEEDQDEVTPEAQEPAQPSQGGGSGQGSSGGGSANTGDTNASTPNDSGESNTSSESRVEAADTSEQYTLGSNANSGRERGRGMGDVPGAGFVMPVARGVIGANELGLLGGGLALFGLLLAVVAFRRERRAEAE